MKFFLRSLLLVFVPFFINASSFSNGLASYVIQEANSAFYSGPHNLISDHDDLSNLCTFTDDLVLVLESALADNPSMSAFELAALALQDLKLKLIKIEHFGSKAGMSIYNCFLNHFCKKFSKNGDFEAFLLTSNLYSKVPHSMPEIKEPSISVESNSDTKELNYIDSRIANIIGEVRIVLYRGPHSLISAHEELFSLYTFEDDLVLFLKFALNDNPVMTDFELASVVLDYLKHKLMEIGQFESKPGKSFYNSFLNYFDETFYEKKAPNPNDEGHKNIDSGLASYVIQEANSAFYSGPHNLISDHDDLSNLCTFTDDLVLVLESALADNPSMSAFELAALALQDLKLKLIKIEHFGSKAGMSIYNCFLNHFCKKFSKNGDFEAFLLTSNLYSKVSHSMPEIKEPSISVESNPDTKELNYIDCIYEAKDNSAHVSLKSSEDGNLHGKKRSKRCCSSNNEKKWQIVSSSLSVLPSKVFLFSLNIVDQAESVSYLNASSIYNYLLTLFNRYISNQVPYTADAIKKIFKDQAIAFIETLGSDSDEQTKKAFVNVIVEFADEIISEIEDNFNGEEAEVTEIDDEEEDVVPKKISKKSNETEFTGF